MAAVNEEIFDEGTGARLENGIRQINEMLMTIDRARIILENALGEAQANYGFIRNGRTHDFIQTILRGIEYDNYILIEQAMHFFLGQHRPRFR